MPAKMEQVRELFAQHQIDALLITNPYNRRYLTGFTGTAGLVLITTTDAFFVTDFRYVEQAQEQTRGYTVVEHKGPIQETLASLLSQNKIKRLGFEADFMTVATYRLYEAQLTSCTLVPLPNIIEGLRMVKTEEEIALITKAVEIADAAFTHIVNFIKPGVTELEVAHELEMYMRKLGASSSSFDIIVASGIRSALPHGVATEKMINSGELVTLDFGCFYQGYASDITRTVAVGEPGAKLKEIYEICLQAQVNGVQQIRAGISAQEADAFCRDVITAKGYGPYFGHSTGHGLGLEVHEYPRLATKVEMILRPGMVVTVEPGIYLTGLGGVRIEDDIVLTEEGNRVLSKSSKELIIID